MQGSPLFRLGLIVAAMCLMFFPLRHLTRGHTEVVPIAEKQQKTSALRVEITATAPFTFVLKHLGKVIWKGEAGVRSVEQSLSLSFPPEGLELGLEGELKEATEAAALRVRVLTDDALPREKVLWATGRVDEILVFQP